LTALTLVLAFWTDAGAMAWISSHRSGPAVWLGGWITELTKWHWFCLPFALAAFVAWRLRRKETARLLLLAIVSGSLAGLGADVIRPLTGRARPNAPAIVEQGWHGCVRGGRIELLDANYYSFPSGHVSVAAGLVLYLVIARFGLGLALLFLPLSVAWARLITLAHHPSDALAAFILGFFTAHAVYRHRHLLEKWTQRGNP